MKGVGRIRKSRFGGEDKQFTISTNLYPKEPLCMHCACPLWVDGREMEAGTVHLASLLDCDSQF